MEQKVKDFIEMIRSTSLSGEEKIYYIERFTEKGYLTEDENKSLITALENENALIDEFAENNLSS